MSVLYKKSPSIWFVCNIQNHNGCDTLPSKLENVLTPILCMWKLAKSKFDDNEKLEGKLEQYC